MTNSPLVNSKKEIKLKLQTLLEAGHVDEYFVEDICSLMYPKSSTNNIIAGVDFSTSLNMLESL
tara:strand:- start:9 stop:200 length:192 start_codon:yes stop_codon:yes gene_type:complete